jgi:hypothetical protein
MEPSEACEAFRLAHGVRVTRDSQVSRVNLFLSLLTNGHFDEARSMAAELDSEEAALARVEVVRERWSLAESLGTVAALDPALPLRMRLYAAQAAASGSLAQGRVVRATRIMEGIRHQAAAARDRHVEWMTGDSQMSMVLFSGSSIPSVPTGPPDTSFVGTLSSVYRANIAGSAEKAATGLRRLVADPRSTWPDHALRVPLLSGWTALTQGRVEEGAAVLRAVAFQPGGPSYFDPDELRARQTARWLMAGVYESKGRPDSAAICLETMLAPVGRYRDRLSDRGFFLSFARRRLVLLYYARMGQLDAARRHWETFQQAFSDPDPELRPLVDEARAALAAAEAMAKGSRL